jgi:hypothetical protein
MKPNAFIGQSRKPTEKQLAEALGPAKTAWDGLAEGLAKEQSLTREWKSYSIKMGWSLRLKRKERSIVYLSPFRDGFQAAFIFGDKAMGTVRKTEWPQRIQKILSEAPRYPEGTGIRLNIKKPKDTEIVKQLAAIKLAH